MSRFDECLPLTLAQECPCPADWSNPRNFSDDKGDPGGKTFCGLTQKEYDAYRRKLGAPTRDVRQMTAAEGHNIYLTSYWLPHCPQLPPGLDLQFFDEAVNAGVGEATKVLQFALGLHVDGVWGPMTADAVKRIRDVGAVVKAYTFRRHDVYEQMPGFHEFGRDWLSRASEIGAYALKMTQAAPAPAPAPQPTAPKEPTMPQTTTPAPATAKSSTTLQSIDNVIRQAEGFAPVLAIIPQTAPFSGAAVTILTLADQALQQIMAVQNMSLPDALKALLQHMTAGQPNAPALSGTPPSSAVPL